MRRAQHDSPTREQARVEEENLSNQIADEPIRWPDPSPLEDWWARVMAKSIP